jgi:hypothetical protein
MGLATLSARRRTADPEVAVRTLSFLVLVLSVGCEKQAIVQDNAGVACIDVDPDGAVPAEVTVVFDECASACATILTASCNVTVEGSRVIVSSKYAFEPPPENRDCAAVCEIHQAVCPVDELPDGNYTLEFGAATEDFIWPAEDPVCIEVFLG